MISAKVLGKHAEKFVVDNAPVILTGIGVVGSVAGAYLTGKGTLRAVTIMQDEADRRFREDPNFKEEDDIPLKDVMKLTWKEYVPAVSVVGATVASIVCANRISTKRAAALALAYSLSEKRMTDYKDKVIEKFNPSKERQIRDEIAQDQVRANPPKDSQIIITGNGDVLCYDAPTGRYFRSNMEKLRSVQNDINAEVIEVGFCTLQDLYVAMNLDPTPYSDQIGWTTDTLLDLHFSAVLTDDNQPCISIDYHCKPVRAGSVAGFPKGCDEDPGF